MTPLASWTVVALLAAISWIAAKMYAHTEEKDQ